MNNDGDITPVVFVSMYDDDVMAICYEEWFAMTITCDITRNDATNFLEVTAISGAFNGNASDQCSHLLESIIIDIDSCYCT